MIAVILLRYINRDRIRTEYDEMQKVIRGKGYMIAFYTVMVLEGILCFLSPLMETVVEPYVIHFAVIFIGITVQASYCIWKGAYVGLNTNMKRFTGVCIAVVVLNVFPAVMAIWTGTMFENGHLQAPFVNCLCALMFAVLGGVGLARRLCDREVDE